MTAAGLCSAAIVYWLTRVGRGSVRTYWYATLAFTLLRLTFNAAGVVKHVTDARVRNAAASLAGVPQIARGSGTERRLERSRADLRASR